MCSVDDEAIILDVKLRLCSKFAAKELGRVCKMIKT